MENNNINSFLNYLELEKRYSAHTLTSYKKDLNDFLIYLNSVYGLPIEKIDLIHARSYMVTLIENNLARSTVSRKISAIKSFFKFLLKKGIINSSPVHLLETQKLAKRLPVFVKEDDLSKLFSNDNFNNNIEGIRDQLIMTLFYQTGIRLSELINIKEKDVGVNEIKVTGKRNKQRLIPLTPNLLNLISSYREQKKRLFGSQPYLILTDKGNKLYEKFVYRKVNGYLSLVSSKQKKSPHILRHTFATHMLNNGADLNAIKELLGHENLAATQIYTHNTFQKLKSIHQQSHPRG
ncbi:MAG: tyrosine-type recombinase/integrase [Bacteroidota bacterium]|nr:tyrosine-type recombinase/integrase [Bacteroidota bacterium]